MANIAVTVSGNENWLGIQNNIKKTSETAKQLFGDVGKLGASFKGMAGDLSKLSGLSALTFAGLIATAPRLAGNLAQLEFAIYQITDALSRSAKPAVDLFTDAMLGLGSYLQNNQWASDLAAGALIAGVALGTLKLAAGALSLALGGTKLVIGGLAAAELALNAFALKTFGVGAFSSLALGVIWPITLAFIIPNLINLLPSQNKEFEQQAVENARKVPILGNDLGLISTLFRGGVEGIAKIEGGGQNLLRGLLGNEEFQAASPMISELAKTSQHGRQGILIVQVMDSMGNILQHYHN